MRKEFFSRRDELRIKGEITRMIQLAVGNWQKKKKRGNEETEKRRNMGRNMGSGNLFTSERIEKGQSGKTKTMKILTLVHCRGLIYQALSQAIHLLGLMNQTPTSRPLAFFAANVLFGSFCVLLWLTPSLEISGVASQNLTFESGGRKERRKKETEKNRSIVLNTRVEIWNTLYYNTTMNQEKNLRSR